MAQQSKKGGSGFNFRDSDSGRYIKPREAEHRPPSTWEKERRPATPPPKKGK